MCVSSLPPLGCHVLQSAPVLVSHMGDALTEAQAMVKALQDNANQVNDSMQSKLSAGAQAVDSIKEHMSSLGALLKDKQAVVVQETETAQQAMAQTMKALGDDCATTVGGNQSPSPPPYSIPHKHLLSEALHRPTHDSIFDMCVLHHTAQVGPV